MDSQIALYFKDVTDLEELYDSQTREIVRVKMSEIHSFIEHKYMNLLKVHEYEIEVLLMNS